MKSILRTILRFPFKLSLLPVIMIYSIIIVFRYRRLLFNDTATIIGLSLVLEKIRFIYETIEIVIDVTLIMMTAGLYCFLLENEIED
jgi:hypothetical protein